LTGYYPFVEKNRNKTMLPITTLVINSTMLACVSSLAVFNTHEQLFQSQLKYQSKKGKYHIESIFIDTAYVLVLGSYVNLK